MNCGLLGRKLGHSYSPAIHALLADYEYRLYEKEPEELEDFLKNGDFHGLNVTIPYKKAVVPYCAELSPLARELGSVNTLVRRPDGTLYGDNTDCDGFAYQIQCSGIPVEGKKVLVLGTGGASLAVNYVLKKLGAGEIVGISRNGENNYQNLDKHGDAQVIVNTTPVGMYPNNGLSPLSLNGFSALLGVLDVVYNPLRTALCLEAERRGVPAMSGLRMLVSQARRSAELFMDTQIPDERVEEVYQTLAHTMGNIVLVGMPGSGKTTIGTALARELGRTFIDADDALVERAGMDIPAYFAAYGEPAFRDLETQVLADLGKKSGCIIATGGGCVLREENYDLLHQNGWIFWIQREIDQLPTDGRPLSRTSNLSEMYRKREPHYARFADGIIRNHGAVEMAVRGIKEKLV